MEINQIKQALEYRESPLARDALLIKIINAGFKIGFAKEHTKPIGEHEHRRICEIALDRLATNSGFRQEKNPQKQQEIIVATYDKSFCAQREIKFNKPRKGSKADIGYTTETRLSQTSSEYHNPTIRRGR